MQEARVAEPIGRARECATLRALLTHGGALRLVGEAGSGRSRLLQWLGAVAAEDGIRVLAAAPVPEEADLDLAVLGDLAAALAGHFDLGLLPVPQREVVEVLTLRAPAPEPPFDARHLGTALGAVLAQAAPLLLLIDDAAHMDGSSARALAFALRRVGPGISAVLVGGAGPASVPDLVVPPLAPADVEAVLRHARPGSTLAAIERAAGLADGNPGRAIEILDHGSSTAGQMPNRAGPAFPPPLPPSLLDAARPVIAARVPDERIGLAVVAALAQVAEATAATIRAAGLTTEVDRAVAAGLVRADLVDGKLRYRPRSAIEGVVALIDTDERDVRIDRLADGLGDAGREACLRAFGGGTVAVGDAELLLAAARAALAAGRRGKAAALAMSVAEVAAHTTGSAADAPDAAARRAEVRRAARVLCRAGDLVTARAVLAALGPDAASADHAVLDAVAGGWDAVRLARALEAADDPSLGEAAGGAAGAWTGCVSGAGPESGGTAEVVGRLGAVALRPGGWDGTLAIAPALTLAEILLATDAHDQVAAVLDRVEADLAGDEPGAVRVASLRARVALARGDTARALAHAVEAADRAGRWSSPPATMRSRLDLAAIRLQLGDLAFATATAADVLALAVAVDDRWAARDSHELAAVAELSAGRPEQAIEHFAAANAIADALGIGEVGLRRHDGDHVEGLLALGRVADALEVLEQLDDRAERAGRPRPLAVRDRSAALVAAVDGRVRDAVEAAESSLARLAAGTWPLERARGLLTLGQIHRRAKRRGDARAALDQALAGFLAVDAAAFAERTRRELARLGVVRTDGPGDLTEAERRVAEAIVGGATVKEAGATLFLSPKTVEAHLTRVYRKLGISTRAELGARWADVDGRVDGAIPSV